MNKILNTNIRFWDSRCYCCVFSVVCSFFLLTFVLRSPGWIGLSIFLLMDMWVVFSFWLRWMPHLWILVRKLLWKHTFFSLKYTPGSQLFNFIGNCRWVFQSGPSIFTVREWEVQLFYIPPALWKPFTFQPYWWACKGGHCGFTCLSLMNSDTEHLFMYLLLVWTSSLLKDWASVFSIL